MKKEELDHEITETIKVIKELEFTGNPGALKLAMDDLKGLAILKHDMDFGYHE